jgi:hypothetical protein
MDVAVWRLPHSYIHFTAEKNNQYPLYRGWVGEPHGRSKRVQKISPPPESYHRTAQSVASRYTHYANPASVYSYSSESVSQASIFRQKF